MEPEADLKWGPTSCLEVESDSVSNFVWAIVPDET